MISADKLAYFLGDRYLSGEDSEFVDWVITDLEEFQAQCSDKIVLLFPPVNNYLRLLIHKTVEDFSHLHSFSVGEGDKRQTVVCWTKSLIIQDQDTKASSDYPRPLEMRGRGRGRLKDRSSPSPSPGNSHGSGDNDGRWSHNMYNSESDTTMQAGTYDKTKAVQGSRHQSPGMACQLNELRSSPIGRQINKNDTRTTSPASGDSDTPNRTRKPERSKNRRPDVQVYVPRARRQQMGKSRPENQAEKDRPELSTRNKHQTGQSGGAESQASFENQEESSRTDQQAPSDRQLRQVIITFVFASTSLEVFEFCRHFHNLISLMYVLICYDELVI